MTAAAEQTVESLARVTHIRPSNRADEGFIYSTWLHSLEPRQRKRTRDYFGNRHAQIDKVLGHPATQIVVASAPDDHRHILGWLAVAGTDPRVIHWAYVRGGRDPGPGPGRGRRAGYRGFGLFWFLLAVAGISRASEVLYTFTNYRAERMAKKFARAEYMTPEEFAAL